MSQQQESIASMGQGEFRKPTPKEVGEVVKMLREGLGMKQFALAEAANMTERTLQRVESGVKASDATLKRLAVALNLAEDAFTSQQHILNPDEVQQEVERLQAEYSVLDVRPLVEEHDLRSVFPTHAMWFDDTAVVGDAADISAELHEVMNDWLDVYRECSSSEQLQARRGMLDYVKQLEECGYRLFGGRKKATFDVGNGVEMEVGVVVCRPTSEPDLSQVMVPSKMSFGDI